MPRVPTARTTTQPPLHVPQAPQDFTVQNANARAGMLNQGARLGYIGAEIAIALGAKRTREKSAAQQILDEATRRDTYIEKASQFNRTLTDLKASADRPDVFAQEADAALGEILDGIEDEEVLLRVKERGMFAIDSAYTSVAAQASQAQRAAAREKFGTEILSDSAEAAARADLSGNDVEIDRIRMEWLDDLGATGHYTDEEKAELDASWQEQREGDVIRILLEMAISDPETAALTLAEAKVRLRQNFSPNIDTEDRLSFARQINTATDSAQTRLMAQLREQADSDADGFLARMSPDAEPANHPTHAEIDASGMTVPEKRIFHNEIVKLSQGIDVSKGIPAAENELIARVHGFNRLDAITAVHQLIPFLDGRLGQTLFATLRADIERKNKPELKSQEAQFSATMIAIKANFVGGGLLSGKDPVGESDYRNFWPEGRRLWIEGIAAGKTPAQLTNNESPDYIGKNLHKFLTPEMDKLDAKMQMLSGSGVPVPVEDEELPPRKAGESAEEWLRRFRGAR